MKSTQAFTSWLQDSQGERYTRELTAHAEECLLALVAVAAVSTDPAVRAKHARWVAFDEQAKFLRNSRKESTSNDDE